MECVPKQAFGILGKQIPVKGIWKRKQKWHQLSLSGKQTETTVRSVCKSTVVLQAMLYYKSKLIYIAGHRTKAKLLSYLKPNFYQIEAKVFNQLNLIRVSHAQAKLLSNPSYNLSLRYKANDFRKQTECLLQARPRWPMN